LGQPADRTFVKSRVSPRPHDPTSGKSGNLLRCSDKVSAMCDNRTEMKTSAPESLAIRGHYIDLRVGVISARRSGMRI